MIILHVFSVITTLEYDFIRETKKNFSRLTIFKIQIKEKPLSTDNPPGNKTS